MARPLDAPEGAFGVKGAENASLLEFRLRVRHRGHYHYFTVPIGVPMFAALYYLSAMVVFCGAWVMSSIIDWME